MTFRNAAVCDGPGCETWTRSPEEHGFLDLTWGRSYVFCSGDCALKWLAERTAPNEEIDFDG